MMNDSKRSGGRLKIYLGYAPGVGKTYQMLEEAFRLKALGIDVVVGALDARGRADVAEKARGLETIACHTVEMRGRRSEELDVAAIVKRGPQVVVADDLAHVNLPIARRRTRWQEVLELLDDGIDVLTTLDVSNVESLSDQVWHITGVLVRQTVPDWVVNRADEMVMVDVTPRALLNRLERGAIVPPEGKERARATVFNEAALVALRELAIRQTVHKVEMAFDSSITPGPAEKNGSRNHIVVHVDSDPSGAMLLRRGRRLADFLHGRCTAVVVHKEPSFQQIPEGKRTALERHLRFAESMQIETAVEQGVDCARTITDFAHQHHATHLLLSRGHDQHRYFPGLDFVDRVLQRAGNVEVTVAGELRREGRAPAAYAEDTAAEWMSEDYARLSPEMTVEEATAHLRRQAERIEMIYYAYVLSPSDELLGVVSFRELLASPRDRRVQDVMHRDFVSVYEDTDKDEVAELFSKRHLLAIPVVDYHRRLRGIISVGDLVDLIKEEAAEDIQKFGGMEALDTPYLTTGFVHMVRKRAGWLAVLFLGEMLTATAMGYFSDEIAKAVVLAMFLPLIISSGGNSGSQATTLVIRAMALGELTMRDWWRVVRRELLSGLALGLILGGIGIARIILWHDIHGSYGEHYLVIALTIGLALIGVVTFGTIAGSMLPFILKTCGLDPASASAPFVATLVDVSGLVIYFSVAKFVLQGSLL